MLASAVGPSSQGVWKTKWSLAETAANPQSLAASTAASQPPQGEPLLAELHQRQMDAELHPPMLSASRCERRALARPGCNGSCRRH